jgi:hypothetical protein
LSISFAAVPRGAAAPRSVTLHAAVIAFRQPAGAQLHVVVWMVISKSQFAGAILLPTCRTEALILVNIHL